MSLRRVTVSLEEDPSGARDVFSSFITELVTVLEDRQDREELRIVNKGQ